MRDLVGRRSHVGDWPSAVESVQSRGLTSHMRIGGKSQRKVSASLLLRLGLRRDRIVASLQVENKWAIEKMAAMFPLEKFLFTTLYNQVYKLAKTDSYYGEFVLNLAGIAMNLSFDHKLSTLAHVHSGSADALLATVVSKLSNVCTSLYAYNDHNKWF